MSSTPGGRHVLRFQGTMAGLEAAAGELRGLLDARELAGGSRNAVELVFDEIGGNIVRHGHPTGPIEVAIDFDVDTEIVLTFEDDGVPFDPRAAAEPPVPTSIEEAPIGGLGLVMVRRVSTRMDYERTAARRNLLVLAIPSR